jgi:steroid delta-isomerase-like uncharacterized protein
MNNKELVSTYFERAFVKHDLDAAAKLVSDDYSIHGPFQTGSQKGPSAFKGAHSLYLRAMRDHTAKIDDQIAEGDKVVTRWTASGCQIKDLPGIPDKGKCFKIGGVTIYRVSDGKIAEEWGNWDTADFARQLGAV